MFEVRIKFIILKFSANHYSSFFLSHEAFFFHGATQISCMSELDDFLVKSGRRNLNKFVFKYNRELVTSHSDLSNK